MNRFCSKGISAVFPPDGLWGRLEMEALQFIGTENDDQRRVRQFRAPRR